MQGKGYKYLSILSFFLFALFPLLLQPGRPSYAADHISISEIRIDQSSTDNDEYFELSGASGESLAGLTYLVIGDGTGGSGVIEAVVGLDGQTIPASGFFVAAEGTFTMGTADLTTGLNFENSDNVTHLLVGGFSGADGDDLDSNDDGTLDATPWSELVACVALVETPGSGDQIYCANEVGPDGSFVPGHVYICDDGWRIGPFDPAAGDDSPGATNACGDDGGGDDGGGDDATFGSCGDPATFIHAIQGSGTSSSEVGNSHVIEGIVVGDFQDTGVELSGFFLQEEDAQHDGDAATSEGIFVFDNGFGTDVVVGDVVRVLGSVTEFFGLTELNNVTNLAVCSNGSSATATSLNLPVADLSDWESYEGMLVTFPQTLYATDNFNQGRFGEVLLSADGRLYSPTNVAEPGAPANAVQAQNDLRSILLDDGSNIQNPLPLPPYLGVDDTLRAGDTTSGVTGVLSFGFSRYRLHPTGPVTFDRVNERPATPADVGGSLQVASFNVLNYFNGDGAGGGFPTSRGADTLEEFIQQRDKIIAAITLMDADVIGLMEIENDGYRSRSAIQDLVNGLNDATAPGTYAFIDPGVSQIGTDEIAVGLLYRPAAVTPVGTAAILDSTVDPDFIDTKNRPVLAQTFVENASGGRFTVAVNHLKSKGSDCNDIGDPDTGDGQGNCNLTRVQAAQALADWLATDPTHSNDPDFLIIGDLNAYAMEDPIDTLKAAGYTDLIATYEGPEAYSYVFFGQAGYLDHALSNESLTAQVTGATVWHINADEPRALDYNDFNQPALYDPDPYRSSDHDPVLVGLALNAAPVCSGARPDQPRLWPPDHKFVPITILDVTDPEGDRLTLAVDAILQDESVGAPNSGHTSPDARGIGSPIAAVRAERADDQNGRVYHIYFTARDAYGSCTGEVMVSVPLTRGTPAVDDGPLYDSTAAP